MLHLAVVPLCIESSLAWYRDTFGRESKFFFCGWQTDDINVTYVRPTNAILNSTGNRNLTENLSQQEQFCLLVRPGPYVISSLYTFFLNKEGCDNIALSNQICFYTCVLGLAFVKVYRHGRLWFHYALIKQLEVYKCEPILYIWWIQFLLQMTPNLSKVCLYCAIGNTMYM